MSTHVLVADDTPEVLRLMSMVLEQGGYAVTTVTRGDDADAALRGATRPFDGAVLDEGMPGMSGSEVLAAARSRGDTTPVLLVSGYVIDEPGDPAAGVLLKPFAGRAFSRAVAQLLARPRS